METVMTELSEKECTKRCRYNPWIILIILLLAILFGSCEPSFLSWSASSENVALVWRQKVNAKQIFMLGVTSINEQDIIHFEPPVVLDVADVGTFLSAPAWSPNGKYIAYYRVSPVDSTQLAASKSMSEEDNVQDAYVSYDAQLTIITPDTKHTKVLKKIRWRKRAEFDAEGLYTHLRPAWSTDSNRVFYARMLSKDKYRIESININGEGQKKHMRASIGTVYTSIKGEQIGSVWKNTLKISQIDNEVQKCFELKPGVDPARIRWTEDLSKVAFAKDDRIVTVNVNSGKTECVEDQDVYSVEHVVLSSEGEQIYYIARSKVNGVEAELGEFSVRSVTFEGKDKKVLFSLPQNSIPRQFSISPDENYIVASGTETSSDGQEQVFLLLWKKKTGETLKVNIGGAFNKM